MQPLLDWLFRLDSLRPGGAGVQMGFAFELAPWQWAGAGLLSVILAGWSYRRLDGAVWARGALAACRALLLMLLVVLACGPRLQKPNESIEKDWVLALVDRSASMKIADAAAPAANGSSAPARITREDQLEAILRKATPTFDAIARDRIVLWQGFDAGAFDLKPSIESPGRTLPVILDEPTGTRTQIGAALEQALQRTAARPLSGVVLFTDGRSGDRPSRTLLRRLSGERVPVISIPLGSPDPVGDVAVRSAVGPGVAFAGDVVPVEAVVEHVGSFSRSGADRTARVQLIDTTTGEILEEKAIEWKAPKPGADSPESPASGTDSARPKDSASDTQRVMLTASPTVAGKAQWAVRILPGASGSGDAVSDLVADNNEASFTIDLVDRPLRVLLMDGYPRWEYRFLQAILTRERSLASTGMLLSPGRRYIQEGNTPMDALPVSPGEWESIDVIVIGDVQPEVFSSEQLRQIRQRVSVGGAGLLWIAGESAVPTAWRNTPLADLLPVSAEGGEPVRAWDRDVVVRPTSAAERLGVLRLLRTPVDGSWWPESVGDPRSGWSRLRWAQRLERSQLKPASEVLATANSVVGDESAPLVVSMRYGAGRIIYVGTDEIWRWRYGRGEDLPERFWLQLVRLLGRESVSRAGKPAILTATPARAEVGQAVRTQVELIDQALAESAGSSLTVRVTRLGDSGPFTATSPKTVPAPSAAATPEEVTLRTPAGGARADGRRAAYVGAWVPAQRGVYRLEVVDPLLAAAHVSTDVEVWLAEDEFRRPETDHALLARLAKETGGSVLADGDLSKLEQLLPHREVRITLAPDEHTLWDTPAALLLLIVLVTTEWVGRRLLKLA